MSLTDVIGLRRNVTAMCMEYETHVDKLITFSREVSRRLSNASLFVSLLALLIIYHALTESGNSGKLCHMLSVTLTIQRPYMAIQENLVACFP